MNTETEQPAAPGAASIKTYLGDSVYAEFDGYFYVLTAENGYADDPRNKIALEPEVLGALFRFIDANKPKPADESALSPRFASDLERAIGYAEATAKQSATARTLMAEINPQVSESCEFNPFSGSLWFTVRNRDDVQELLRLAPKWTKEKHESGIDYFATVRGVDLKIRTLDGALPPTCRLVEKVVEVPETVIPAHTEKRMVVECSKLEAETDMP